MPLVPTTGDVPYTAQIKLVEDEFSSLHNVSSHKEKCLTLRTCVILCYIREDEILAVSITI